MKFAIEGGEIDCLDTMYPSHLQSFDPEDSQIIYLDALSTAYGYVSEGVVILPNDKEVCKGEWFSYTTGKEREILESTNAVGVVIQRIGYRGQNVIGGPLEKKGRLCYIDGCSDSILVYPPRQGDPVLNHLHFPAGIEQTYHTHPSIRVGFVVRGRGFADVSDSHPALLVEGMSFVLDAHELHRFRTVDSSIDIIAYHPDSDWGPTDHNHPMLNRTYIGKK